MTDFFALYDALLPEIPQEPILCVSSGDFWTGVETVNNLGLAMTTAGDTAPRCFPVGKRPPPWQSWLLP